MYTQKICALALVLLPFNSAFAEDVTCQAEVIIAPGQKATELIIPMPELWRGTPTGMEIQVMVGVRGLVALENVSDRKALAAFYVDYRANVSACRGQIQLASGDQFMEVMPLGGFDGKLDFAGASGTVVAVRDTSPRRVERLSGKPLAKLLSDVNSKVITFYIDGGAAFTMRGLDSIKHRTNMRMMVQVCVTYSYDKDPSKSRLARNAAFGSTAGQPAVARKPSTQLVPTRDDKPLVA